MRGFLYWFPVFKLCDVSQTLEGDGEQEDAEERQRRGREPQVRIVKCVDS